MMIKGGQPQSPLKNDMLINSHSMDISQYQKIDHTLFHITKKLKVLGYTEALNSQKQKRMFLQDRIENPRFIYKKAQYDTQKIGELLNRLKPPNDDIGKLQQEIIHELHIRNNIIRYIGKAAMIKKLTIKLFCKPSQKLIRNARRILFKEKHNLKYHSESKELTSKDMISHFKSYLINQKLDHWQVTMSRQHSVSIAATQRRIKISPFKRYSESDKKRLEVHEIQGHVFRTENGYNQPLKMFAVGLPKYLSTEEGITTILEEKKGLRTAPLKVRYSLRVIAVHTACSGKSFRDCFNMLKIYDIDDHEAWEITYRAYRGGGFVKDHIYLKGYMDMKSYLKKGGNLVDLYIGKIGFHHRELCNVLQKDKILSRPQYLPNLHD